MTRLITLLALALATMQASAQSLFQQYARQLSGPRSYTCHKLSGKLNIDGRLDEKAWADAAETQPFVDISGYDYPKPKYLTTARMLWDDDYLYVGAMLHDPDIKARLTQRDTIIYHDNDFEVFIDPDGNGMNYFEIETNARGVVFDLMLDRAYRSGGNFMVQWDCPGLQLAVHHLGTINNPSDTDEGWSVEMAIPRQALTMNFDNPLRAGNTWRINFSRVQWLKAGGPEENWVWTPTGRIDMHMPERWGYLHFVDDAPQTSASDTTEPAVGGAPNCPAAVYKLLWAMFYAQQDHYAKHHNYMRSLDQFFLTPLETDSLPADARIEVEATSHTHREAITTAGQTFSVDADGRFQVERVQPRVVKNWLWTKPDTRSLDSWCEWLPQLKECGIAGVMFEGYDADVFRLCHEAGLEAHLWKWTLNRAELLKKHPDWYAVNRKGESCADHPAYVDYYRFLCPRHEGVAEYLAADYKAAAALPYVDGVHLDYVRMPDVVLPVQLWKNYGIEQTQELPAYDFCYCDVCRNLYKAQTGQDPSDMAYPMTSQSWANFRMQGVTEVVRAIATAVKHDHHTISAAVFPGPSLAQRMVRQDWACWPIDAFFPMIYNKFYGEGTAWIGQSVRESVGAVAGRAKVYAGLMFGDIRDDFEAALDQAYDNGADGVSFFDGPDAEHLQRLKLYLKNKGLIAYGQQADTAK